MKNIIKNDIRNIVGERYTIIEPCNLYECTLKEDVFIGPFCEIQNNVIIGEKTRIQSHTFICSNAIIGKECFIGHGVMFVNDLMHESYEISKNNLEKIFVGDNVKIGSNSTILPVKICNNVLIGAGSVVTKDITISGIYMGNPAKIYKKY